MPGTYLYPALTSKRSIRLLYLQGGMCSSGIECTIRHVPLGQHPPYEAISYEWKKHEGFTTIICCSSTIEVTLNLATALEAFRHPSKVRVLWADAVCIDQKNVIEKGHQVSMMRDIYANAESVLVWLGRPCRLTSAAFQVLNLLAFLWIERIELGMKADNPFPFMLYERPQGSVFLSTNDKIWTSFERGYHRKTITLSRPQDYNDDELLHFGNTELWKTVDRLFGNTYFERTWIQQEVAVPNAVYITCGQHHVPFDIFSAAYGGRSLLHFIGRMTEMNKDISIPFSCVRDARKRYQDPTFGSDLATVLATFNYTKETVPHDHIYAPLALVKSQWACGHLKVDYTKALSTVFVEAATCIISDRQDLYLWGTKSFYPNRTMKDIPSWVPEWTGPSCEEAVEYIRHGLGFKYLLEGKYSVQGHSLYADTYILDQIEFSAPVHTKEQILDVMLKLHQKGPGLFERYVGGVLENESLHTTTDCGARDLRQSNLIDAFWIMCTLSHVPDLLIQVLSGLFRSKRHPLDHVRLNIEVLWSVLTPESIFRPQRGPQPPCERLFLAALLLLALKRGEQVGWSIPGGKPKMYSVWAMAATILLHQTSSTSVLDLLFQHLSRSVIREEERFFITKKGYFGRAPLPSHNEDCVVAIVGGACIPYILEKHERHYSLYSHAFVEGIMDWKKLPSNSLVQRIELR
jgi:hypothetical protein